MPKLHNKNRDKSAQARGAVYIGRGSPWGNPYKIGEHGSRDQVCDKYEADALSSPAFIKKVKRELRGKDLVCFCSPLRCHGDFLLRIANE